MELSYQHTDLRASVGDNDKGGDYLGDRYEEQDAHNKADGAYTCEGVHSCACWIYVITVEK